MKKWIVWLGLTLVLLLTLAAYSHHFHGAFHIDDIHAIYDNAYIRDLKNIPQFFTDGRTSSVRPSNQTYRPILTTSIALDYYIGGGNGDTFMYHLTSFFIFLCLGICLFFLCRSVFRRAAAETASDIVALLATAWFMLHPACAETVCYIIQRGDLLATFLVVLALVLYIQSDRARRYFLYLIPVIAAILTKPIAVTFPLLLATYICLFERRDANTFQLKKFLLDIIISIIAAVALGVFVTTMTSATYQTAGDDPWLYRCSQPYVLGLYFVQWFAPLWLAADNGMKVFASPFAPLALLGYAFIATIIIAIIYSRRPLTRPISFGLSWYLIANIPTSLISLNEVATDHRMFLPYVGLSLAITWSLYLAVRWLTQRFSSMQRLQSIVGALAIAALLCYGYGAYRRCQVWQTEETLWSDAISKYPASLRAHLDYGVALMGRGALPEAEAQFTQALAIQPDFAFANLDMGIVKHLQNKDVQSEPYLRHAMETGRESCPPCYYYYAMYLNQQGKVDEAIKVLYGQYRMSEANTECRELLMELLYKAHRADELKQIISATLQLSPTDTRATYYDGLLASSQVMTPTAKTADDYINLSGQAYREGRYQDCIDYALKCLEMRPAFAPAYNNLAAAYNKKHKYKEAKDASLKALQLDPSSRFAKVNLDIAEKGLSQAGHK